ncbi:MAG: hypothetical protein AABX37_02085 [Nanoarchaeota archaeon]
MRDQSHMEQVERWANFVRENPTQWKKIHTGFINALFQKNEEVIQRLLQQQNGKQKLIELYNIKNVAGCDWLKS